VILFLGIPNKDCERAILSKRYFLVCVLLHRAIVFSWRRYEKATTYLVLASYQQERGT